MSSDLFVKVKVALLLLGISRMKTPQLHIKMCLAGISCHAHKIRGSSPLKVRHLALFWLILRCLTHEKEKKYSSCPYNVIPLAQIWSGTYLKKMPRNMSGSHIGFAGSVEGSSVGISKYCLIPSIRWNKCALFAICEHRFNWSDVKRCLK